MIFNYRKCQTVYPAFAFSFTLIDSIQPPSLQHVPFVIEFQKDLLKKSQRLNLLCK